MLNMAVVALHKAPKTDMFTFECFDVESTVEQHVKCDYKNNFLSNAEIHQGWV